MALHVDRDRIHRDMRRGEFDVHGECGRVAAEPLRTDAEHVHRRRQFGFQLRAVGIVALRTKRARRCDLGQMHAQVRRSTDAHADNRRRARPAPCVEYAVDDKGPDRVDAFGRNGHLEPRVVLGATAFGDHFDPQAFEIRSVVDVDHRHTDSAR